jgi:hypothetical protein
MEREAKQRGMAPEAHVFEALVNPSKYVVKGYEDIMSPVHTTPTSLTEGEIIAVAAYLQSQGGKVTLSFPGSLPILRDQITKAGGK